MSFLGAQCWHSNILNSFTISKAIRHMTILSESLEHGLSACQVPTWIHSFHMEIFPLQSRCSSDRSLWSPYFLWIISPLLLQISTMSYSQDSLSQSSYALPGTYLPSLLPQSPLFLVSTFSSSVLCQGCTLVILGLLSRLKSHLWSSLCPLSPQPMVPSSQIPGMSIFLCCSSHFPGCVEFSTLSTSLLSDSVLQHHDSYIPTLECY